MNAQDPAALAPLRTVRTADERCRVEHRPDGSWRIEREEPLAPYARRATDVLEASARRQPDHLLIAQRPHGFEDVGGRWETWTHAQVLDTVRAIGQALVDRRLTPERPVMILSENDVDNQLLALACQYVGVPYVPVTPAYSLLSRDHARLKWLALQVRPGLVFTSDGDAYQAALEAAFPDVEWVATRPGATRAGAFAALLATTPGATLDAAHEAVGPDHIAKVLFTSGTTGEPKGVLFSHRMICSNRQQVAQALPFIFQRPFVVVDWLPWHHTFGGTATFGMALQTGGSYYIDPGKPTAQGIAATVQALREVAPSIYCGTPAGFAALMPYLREDAALRTRFFSNLTAVLAGGAQFAPHIWKQFDEVSVAHCGERFLFVSGLGSTECGPVAAITCRDSDRRMLVGLPTPGMVAKLVPAEGGLELRFSGHSVSPGYWNDPRRSLQSRDEEGFFRLGDAVEFIDPQQPELGLLFAGRLAENFKLRTGTWVVSGALRTAAVKALAPLASEVVIAGEGQDDVGALVFPDLIQCRLLDPGLAADAHAETVLASPLVRQAFAHRLAALSGAGTGSAGRVARLRLECEPATLDSGEVTAKSAISARNVLRRRVESLRDHYADDPSPAVIVASRRS